MEITKIYFDMDGVLADFTEGVIRLTGMELIDQSIRTKEQSALLWKEIGKVSHFYDQLKPMDGAEDFFRRIFDAYEGKVEILTGIPSSIKESAEDKRNWAARILKREVIVHAVPRKDKKKYCTGEGCILIDDLQKNIDEWKDAGGTGILHVSVEETELQLRKHKEKKA